jgi:hypothetical protein
MLFSYNGLIKSRRRDGRVAEGARLESVYTLTGIVGSNPTLSASLAMLPRQFRLQMSKP